MAPGHQLLTFNRIWACLQLYVFPFDILGTISTSLSQSNILSRKNWTEMYMNRGGHLDDKLHVASHVNVGIGNHQWIIIIHCTFYLWITLSVCCITSSKEIAKWQGMFCFGWRIPNRRRYPTYAMVGFITMQYVVHTLHVVLLRI